MKSKQQSIAALSVPPTTTLREAMRIMSAVPRREPNAPAGIIFAVAADRQLLGIATDGDIRRALERGVHLSDPLERAMNVRPFLIRGPKTNDEVLEEVLGEIRKRRWRRDRIRHVIIVDHRNRITDVIQFFDLWRNSEIRFKRIGVVGLGYVGLTLAVTLADHGYQVRGFESDPRIRAMLKRGKPHFYEIGLRELLRDHIGGALEIRSAITPHDACDMYIVAVGTPIGRSGRPSFSHLESAARSIGRVLQQGDAVILRSTVPVGTTRQVVLPLLERLSGLRAGRDFYIAFAPERTVEGKALEELRRIPQVVGGIDRVSAEVASHLFNSITSSSIIVDSLEEAEMVKLANNVFRDVTFGFANELSLICRRWGIDTARVIAAANHGYERGRIPVPSPGVGGYCLKKDPFIYIASAKQKGMTSIFAQRAREVSELMVRAVADEVFGFLTRERRPFKRAKVLIIGLAFKGEPVTSDIRGSTALDLASLLSTQLTAVFGFDPAVDPKDLRGSGIRFVQSIHEGLAGVDAVVVMNNNPAFKALDMRRLLGRAKKKILLVDSWGLYPKEEIAKASNIAQVTL